MGLSSEAVILPYSYIVGQEAIRTALELSYLAPRIGGVLISGDRGTAKSTVVRAFSMMMYNQLPVTLPINATDDRILGGWRLDQLLQGSAEEQPGLLEEAASKGVLYVDEVNLLDDHVVNIILDVSSTGLLYVQREGMDRQLRLDFSLVGTMNPEEGGLRPQLLDRFGLMVDVRVETDLERRREVLRTVLQMDEALAMPTSKFLDRGRDADKATRERLEEARARVYDVDTSKAVKLCAAVAAEFEVAGHRGDIVMALAARALAALEGTQVATTDHVRKVARLAIQHRRSESSGRGPGYWTAQDDERLHAVRLKD
jgi:magnesium chelatase subunit I